MGHVSSSATPIITPHPGPRVLRQLVAGIVGFDETAAHGRFRVQPAGSLMILEISFTTPLHVLSPNEDRVSGQSAHHGFLAGFMPGQVRTAFFGRHAAVQIYLTPSGASRLVWSSGRDIAAAGISPKQVAGVIRFERVHAKLGSPPLAQLAALHGFADQSHLTRDVRRYSGESPRTLIRVQRPTAYSAFNARTADTGPPPAATPRKPVDPR